MIWKQCQACAHVFTDGYFSTGDAEVVFSAINDSQKLGNDIERQRQVSARMVEKVLPYVTAGTWLDVGFGNGALLLTAQEYGFTPVGTDLRAQNTAALKSINIEAHACDITALTLSQPCAVISMADVLEHMPFPKEGLRAAHRLLADDGVLFISMPNADSMLWRILDVTEANPYWGELEHYHNFGRTRLYALLREMGFEPLRYGVSERYRACMEVIAKKKR
ncbi:MAG: class I SAM-dependent methyltransferase [Rhodospirillaceae bacterium]|nr:class I SAM-dependent methyltransferase [Rhodospirillaceae bacterium]